MITTYVFRDQGGIIPGIPNPTSGDGQFPAGLEIDVDLDTRTVVEMRLVPGARVLFPSDEKATKKGGE